MTDDEEAYGRTLDEARELLEQTRVTLRLLRGRTYERRERQVAAVSSALHRKLARMHADAVTVLGEVERTLLFLLERDPAFEIPEPAPAGAFAASAPVRFDP